MLNGLQLSFHTLPTLAFSPPPGVQTSLAQTKIWLPFIPDWLEKGIVREMKEPALLFFSRPFSVPKKTGSRRPVLDLSVLNKMLCIPKFRMETLDRIVKSIVRGLWGTSLDILNAFLNVPIAPVFHKYFAFALGTRIFVFQVLPFGLSTAPWAFSRVIKPIKAHLRRMGVLAFAFLDDCLFLAPTHN